MRQDNKANTADSCQDREHERSSLVLVVLLLVIVLATSSLVGYILGRNSGSRPFGAGDRYNPPDAGKAV